MGYRRRGVGGEEEIIRDKLEKEKVSVYKILRPECIKVPLDVRSKGETVWELIHILYSAGFIHNPGEALETILQRERQGGTTLGEGIAILHGRIPDIKEPAVALGVLPKVRKFTCRYLPRSQNFFQTRMPGSVCDMPGTKWKPWIL